MELTTETPSTQDDVNREIALLCREIVEAQKHISIHQLAHTQLLSSLLHVLDRSAQQRLRRLVETQAASSEPQGRAAESLRVAAELVSLATEGGDAPDPKKIFRLVHGGKDDQ